jgi:hypothetical protein
MSGIYGLIIAFVLGPLVLAVLGEVILAARRRRKALHRIVEAMRAADEAAR